MRVLLDTNVLLDSLLGRAPWCTESDAVLQAAAPGKLDLCVASLTLTNLFYVGRRVIGTNRARLEIRRCLSAFTILSVDRATLVDADALAGADFEDNVQIAAAVRAGLDAIVTRDATGFTHSPMLVLSPTQLVATLPP
jgi:predicted nucleic acid-binding protein